MRRVLPFAALSAMVAAFAFVAWPQGAAERLAPASVQAAGETCSPARPHASGTTVKTVVTVDGSRSYRLHVPPSYTGTTPVPVVLSSHGAGSNAFEQEVYSDFSTKSDAEGFIVAYPQGLAPGGSTFFNAWQLTSVDDVAYINALLNSVESQLCTDRTRVYATGISNGGMLSVRLACSMSHRIAAIAPVAGSYFPPMALNLNAAETCPDTRPVPIIAFHGTADDTVPYPGGQPVGFFVDYRLPQDDDTPAEDILADWAAHNGCTGPREETPIDSEVVLIEYGSCVDGAIAQLYRVDPGGHTWPGSFDVPSLGYTTQQIEATDLIWSFFSGFTVPDADADLVPDIADNCPADANFAQTNNDRNFIDHSPPYNANVDDRTAPNSDLPGDACDSDDDNDGLTDGDEASGAACGGALTNALVADTDGDRYRDGAECALGTDPASAISNPLVTACAPVGDADGDKLSDRIEVCFYGTDPNNADTDGDKAIDGGKDGCEAASLNSDRIVNVADMGMLATAISNVPFRVVSVDVNKDGLWNPADQGLLASFISPSGQCPG